MKKVMRSPVLKGIAFVVCLVCVAVAGLTAGNAVQWFYEQSMVPGSNVYLLESSFEDSDMLGEGFYKAFNILDNALHDDETQNEVSQLLGYDFTGDYYAKLGNKVLKNVDLTEDEVKQSPYYYLVKPGEWESNMDEWGYMYGLANWMDGYDYYWEDEIAADKAAARRQLQDGDCIMLRLTDEQAEVLRAKWETGRDVFYEALTKCLVTFFVALIAFIYLLFVAGCRPEDENVHLVLIDRMYVEFNLALIAGVVIGTAVVVFVLLDVGFNGSQSGVLGLLTKLLTALLVLAFGLVMTLVLSLVRNLKNRTFVERSLILRTIRWCWRTVKRICCWFVDCCKALRDGISHGKDSLWQKSFQNYKIRKVLLLFLGYSGVLAFLAWLLGVSLLFGLCFLLGIAWVYAAIWFLIRRIDGFDRVVDALKRLRGGDLTYKLTDMPAGVFASMADDINSLGDGMQLALQNEVRAERMKSELITNVSHDLKTPLTSILNYSDLLCQEHLTPEEANDYAKIIYQKGLRLKNLTSDLFDISKVQSGAEQIVCERLDACTLVRQALGEQDKAIGDGKLTLKVDLPEHELPIWADGRKMSRVMENLIGNCIKYAMPGTRVFISVKQEENSAVIELKNIANYAMDFDVSEITERFVRGDAARSTEGSGLGLAIAKSYVEACGGTFMVSVDGDLFKVRIAFALHL